MWIVCFLGLLAAASAAYLPFLNVTFYSVLRNSDDSAVSVTLPTQILFGSSYYTIAYVSTNGLISFGTSFTSYNPVSFPINNPVVAPYWDDIDPNGLRELRYGILTQSNGSAVINQVNNYLASSTGDAVDIDWILWAYWYNVCPYTDQTCSSHQSNYFQVILAVQNDFTYSIFIYQCGLIRWTHNIAAVGFSASLQFYANHPLSKTNNVTDIDCYDTVSGWTNIVYRLNSDPPLIIRPAYGNILGGVPVLVSGPYFEENDEISLSFDNNVDVNCTHIDRINVFCVTPFLSKTGHINVKLYKNSYPYSKTSTFYSVSIESAASVGVKGTNRFFKSGETVDITWSPNSLSNNATSEVDVRMYEVQEMSDGTFVNKELAVLAADLSNNGQATITIPTGISGNKVARSTNIVQRSVRFFVELKNKVSNAIDVVSDKIGQWTDSLWVSFTDAVDNALYEACLEWAASEPASVGSMLLDSVTSMTPCPPNVRQARIESSGLVEDTSSRRLVEFFHPNASNCFRQRVPTSSGAGNQCCYRSDGTLIVGSPNGGSIDKVAPAGKKYQIQYWKNVLDHFTEDVWPFILCCKGGKSDCEKYYERRPSDNGSSFNPPVPACVYGDPHIVTLDLHKYTFNGKGEFILIETDDKRLTVQGRMIEASDINGNNAPGTVFSAIAAKQDNSDRVQFEIVQNELICLLNGEKINFDVLKTQDYDNVTVSESDNNTFSATFESGAFLKVQMMNGFISVLIVSLPNQFRNQTRGLMGNYNGDINDDLIPKGGNGIHLPLNSSLQIIHEQFGITWIVNNMEDSIFTYRFAESWSTFYRPSFTPMYKATFVNASLEQTANEICGDDEFCKFDIAVTGRVEIGEATFTGGQNFEQLVNLSQPITCDPPCVHGACVSADVCVCGEGYTGSTCHTIVTSPCSNNPCNGGNCQYHAGNYICTCLPGLTGVFCENTYSLCDSNPCSAGSTCQYQAGTSNFSCICQPDFTGPLCEVAVVSRSRAGLVAGVTVGVILALIIFIVIPTVAVLVVYLYVKKSKNKTSTDHDYQMGPSTDHDYQMAHFPVKA